LKSTLVRRLNLQSTGPGVLDGSVFKFTARSISTNELCEPMMKIALGQVQGLPLLFRHRHPAGNEDKVVPIFGRATGGRIEKEEDISYMIIDYEVPLKAPNGHELDDKKLFADWVNASAEEGNPIGISMAFILQLEDGKAYWIDMYEASGTHVPACVDCRHVLEMESNEQGETILAEEDEQVEAEAGKKHAEYEARLEKLTKEKVELENKLVTAESEKAKIEDDLSTVKAENAKFVAETAKLSLGVQALTNRLDYAETKKPLVDKIIALEKRPELEDFYKKQTFEYLQKEVKRLEVNSATGQAETATQGNPAEKLLAEMQRKKLEAPKTDVKKALEMCAPDLRPKMAEFFKAQGMEADK